ncbi:hypothetical protein MSAN_02089400 [Mycena sanguinolenta]|uniref:Uncharacterized protein n=1 Tax=Mycena sanguinolenta TaxID=230812 RepID=A0A8H7CM24_9AGAR|nr:hypothetical protein MSAN_02089400 [Mycena sanguinolenta]
MSSLYHGNGSFSTAEYIDNRKKIIRYTSWALDDNGPGWYEHPTPRGLVHGASGYTDPTGLFRRGLRQPFHRCCGHDLRRA